MKIPQSPDLEKLGIKFVLAVRPGEISISLKAKTIWKGEVQVFDLNGHPKAKRAYGWSHLDGDDNIGERFVTVLEIPPVTSAEIAVKISIVADLKKKK